MMVKIYTKTGDDGTTGLIGNIRIKKSHPRIIAYGTIDELNAMLGVVLSSNIDSDLDDILTQIQNDLFVVGADLANPSLSDKSTQVVPSMVSFLESKIDSLEQTLAPITYFILPGGDSIASLLHLARTICRRAETEMVILSEKESLNKNCIIYINRLSDLLFVMARTVNARKKISDVAWEK